MLSFQKLCHSDECPVGFLSLDIGQIVYIAEMKGTCHAVVDTLRVPIAEIAFGSDPAQALKMDTSEGTGVYAHPAPHTCGFVNSHRMGDRIALNGGGGTDLQACGRFALVTGHGEYGSLIEVDMDPDVGILSLEPPGILKRADPFAVPAGQAPILFNKYDFHDNISP